ncbi:hypothetical protein QJQ45_017274 [Haematococcus lacustris]|nr:hypothetical protein QJQ45_017274 [Haematococcus lacustris]
MGMGRSLQPEKAVPETRSCPGAELTAEEGGCVEGTSRGHGEEAEEEGEEAEEEEPEEEEVEEVEGEEAEEEERGVEGIKLHGSHCFRFGELEQAWPAAKGDSINAVSHGGSLLKGGVNWRVKLALKLSQELRAWLDSRLRYQAAGQKSELADLAHELGDLIRNGR